MAKISPWLICLTFLFLGISIPEFAHAEIIPISGPIATDTTWSPPNIYVIDSAFSVPAGVTLTIEPGTIVKAKNTDRLGPGISGNFIAHGTSELPIYFTSWNDDIIGGDTNGDGPSAGTPGSWQGLYFKSGSTGSFDHVNLSYAGNGGPYYYDYGHLIGIENDGGNLEIKNSNIYDNYRITSNGAGGSMGSGMGVYNKNGTLYITNSVIENNVNGIRIDSGSVTISNNEIKNNIDSTGYAYGYGIVAYGPGQLTLLNNNFSGNGRTAFVEASKEFTHSGNTSLDLSRRAFHIGGVLDNDFTLSAGDLPYIIEYLIIPTDKTFTIEPGVIIKMEDRYSNGSISAQGGNLIARGTPENKIYITSLKDDSVGGDTNGDGENSAPSPRNWSAIFLESGSKAEFDNVVLRYGGYRPYSEYLAGVYAAVYQLGAEFSVSNSSFEQNQSTVIYQDAGTTTISHSEFVGDQQMALWSRGGAATISQSAFHGNNSNSQVVYNQSGLDLGWWWQTRPLQIIDARNNWWGSTDGPHNFSTSTPTGSGGGVSENVLYVPFLTSWPPVEEEQKINPVIIIPGIMGSAYKNGELVIDPILHTYDDLIATLVANGYEKEKNLFTFPYEWRNSNVITANLLKNKIALVKQECLAANLPDIDCSKVDLVAHSMGGLVAREYIQSGQYQNNVDQLIFLGTPHKGSPKDYLTWEAGEFQPGIIESLIKLKFTAEALQNFHLSLFGYIRNRPISSIQELLPIFDYIKDKDTDVVRIYPDNYPRNLFLEALNLNTSKLLSSGVKITNFVGNAGNNTIEKIRVISGSSSEKWIHGEPDGFYQNEGDGGLERGTGDDTVTIYGSTLDSSVINNELNAKHADLPTAAEGDIVKILTGNDSVENIDHGIIYNMLVIQLHSPIDMVITDPNGKKMGKDFGSGQIYNEIPLAFYSGYQTDDEFITIPNPIEGEYKVELQGTGEGGKYGVSTSYVSDDSLVTQGVIGITEPNQITNLIIDFNIENPETISPEKIVTPDTLINDINGAYNLGWIKDEKTRDALIKQINNAIKFNKKIEKVVEKLPDGSKREKRIEKFNVKVDKILAKLFEKELELLLKKGKITQEAYDLIIYDVEYLINN